MVICPVALAVHCTGCPLVKFCPAKTILGDFGKETGDDASQGEDDGGGQAPASEETSPS